MGVMVDTFSDEDTAGSKALCMRLPKGDLLLVIANASEQYFSCGGYRPLIDLVNRSLVEGLSSSICNYSDRLLDVATTIKRNMKTAFPSTYTFPGEDVYSATFIAGVASERQVHLGWVGSYQAQLFRGQRCVETTIPHVTVRASGFVVTNRVLSTEPNHDSQTADIAGPWAIAPQDALVIADYRLLTLLEESQVAEVLATEWVAPAKTLVGLGGKQNRIKGQSALVARFG